MNPFNNRVLSLLAVLIVTASSQWAKAECATTTNPSGGTTTVCNNTNGQMNNVNFGVPSNSGFGGFDLGSLDSWLGQMNLPQMSAQPVYQPAPAPAAAQPDPQQQAWPAPPAFDPSIFSSLFQNSGGGDSSGDFLNGWGKSYDVYGPTLFY